MKRAIVGSRLFQSFSECYQRPNTTLFTPLCDRDLGGSSGLIAYQRRYSAFESYRRPATGLPPGGERADDTTKEVLLARDRYLSYTIQSGSFLRCKSFYFINSKEVSPPELVCNEVNVLRYFT